VTPFYFGDAKRPLYGLYHAPRVSVARNSAVLLCPSIATEHESTRATLAGLAGKLAASGHHVLRFDYSACGESAGEIGKGQFLRWLRDIDTAVAELTALSGADRLAVVGIRIGALLAATALATVRTSVRRLVLWDPVVSGAECMAALERQHQRRFRGRRPSADGMDDLLGYRFPADLRRNLRFTDLRQDLDFSPGTQVCLALSEHRPHFHELAEFLRARRAAVEAIRLPQPASWHIDASLSDSACGERSIDMVASALDKP
jgi:alpha-beta hydrolase superfamily lysophospholipase